MMSARCESLALRLREGHETRPLLDWQDEEDDEEEDEETNEEERVETGHRGRNCGSCGREEKRSWRHEARGGENARKGGRGAPCPGAGIFLALLSSLAVTINSVLVKSIESVTALEIAFIRFFFMAASMLPLLILYRQPLLFPKGQRLCVSLLLVLRGVLGSAGNICVVLALRALPLGDATVITFSRAALTGLLARALLGEPCSPWDPPLAALAFAGVTMTARPPFVFGGDADNDVPATSRLLGSLVALLGALCSAGAFVCMRRLGGSVNPLASTWPFPLTGMAQSLLLLLLLLPLAPSEPPPGFPRAPPCDPPWTRLALVLTGPLAALGQLSLSRALQLEGAGLVAAVRTCDVLLAMGAQAAVVGEGVPATLSLVGGACVALSAVGAALVKKGPGETERGSAGVEVALERE